MRPSGGEVGPVISAIGTDQMAPALLSFLSDLCGAEHSAVFVLERGGLSHRCSASRDGTDTANRRAQLIATSQCWRDDEGFVRAGNAGRSVGLIRADMRRAKSAWLRQKIYFDVSERVLMHGCSSDGRVVAITAIQSISGQGFSDAGIDGLTEMAGVLVPILAKHIEYCEYRHSAGRALSSLEEIERCISKTRRLTLRETEVCARTVYGMSTAGIAHALGIGEESVKTYRRRAYEKVGVGSSREIVGWYLARWSEAIH